MQKIKVRSTVFVKVGKHGSFWPTVSNYRIVWFGNNVTHVTLKSYTYTSQILTSDICLLYGNCLRSNLDHKPEGNAYCVCILIT